MRFFREHQLKVRMPILSALAGRQIEQVTTIQDLRDASLLTGFNSDGRWLLQNVAKIMQDCYPETMATYILVNVPRVFFFAWKIISRWLDEEVRNKFIVTTAETQRDVLLEYIKPQWLPAMYGGDCECSGELGCLGSDHGPWVEFERESQRGKLRGIWTAEDREWELPEPCCEHKKTDRRLVNMSAKKSSMATGNPSQNSLTTESSHSSQRLILA